MNFDKLGKIDGVQTNQVRLSGPNTQNPHNMHAQEAEILNTFQREFDLTAIQRGTCELVTFTMTETLSVRNFARCKDITMTVKRRDALVEDFTRFGGHAFSPDNLVTKHNDILTYAPASRLTAIEGSWNEKRYAVKLVYKYKDINPNGSFVTFKPTPTSREEFKFIFITVLGYTHKASLDMSGNLVPETTFVVDKIDTTNSLGHVTYNVTHNPNVSQQIDINFNAMELNNPDNNLFSMRPDDILVQVANQEEVNVPTNVLNEVPYESDTRYNNPLTLLGDTMSNIHVANSNRGENDTRDDIMIKSAIYGCGANINHNPLFSWLDDRYGAKCISFNLGDMYAFFDEIIGVGRGMSYVRQFAKVIVSNNKNVSVFDGAENSRDNILYTTAHAFIDSLQPVLIGNDIQDIAFSVTNMTHTRETVVNLEGDKNITFTKPNKNVLETFRKFEASLRSIVFPIVTKNRYSISIICIINKEGARVTVKIDGFGEDTIAIAMFAYSAMCPTIGSYDENNKAVAGINSLSKQIIGL